MAQTNDKGVPELLPRDILSPSATLLGFIITALGIVISLSADQPDFMKNIFYILFFAIVFLILSAILTIVSSIRESRSIWWWARTIYVASWVFLGLIIIIILIGMVFGVKAFQIQLPEFDTNIVSALGFVSALLSFIFSYLNMRKYENELKDSMLELSTSLEKDKTLIDNTIQDSTFEQELDKEMSFMRVFIDIEKTLRDINLKLRPDQGGLGPVSIRMIVKGLNKKGLIDDERVRAFSIINRIRNNVVHGGKVNTNELDMALDIGASLLITFVRLKHKL